MSMFTDCVLSSSDDCFGSGAGGGGGGASPLSSPLETKEYSLYQRCKNHF